MSGERATPATGTIPDFDPAPSRHRNPKDAVARSSGRFALLLPLAIFVGGALLSVAAAGLLHGRLEEADDAYFALQAEHLQQRLAQQLNYYAYGLSGTNAALTSRGLSREQFEAYVAARNLELEFPGALGLGFIRRVRPQDLDAFLARAQAKEASFRLHPEGAPGADRYVVEYIEPADRNPAALGLDIATAPIARATAEQAMRSGRATLTPLIPLPPSGQAGFLYLRPMYEGSNTPPSEAERVAKLAGWVYMPIPIDDAMASFAQAPDRQVEFEIRDGDSKVFASAPLDGMPHRNALGFDVANRRWTLLTGARAEFDRQDHWVAPLVVAVAGTLIAALAALLAGSSRRTRRRAEQLALTMTEDLRASREHLRSSEERFDLAVQASSQGIWDWDVVREQIYLSDLALEQLGYPPGEQLFLQNDTDILAKHVHPEDLPHVRAAFERHLADGRPYEVEVRVLRRDGALRWLLHRGQAVRDASGAPVRIIGTMNDVTERKAAEQALVEARETAEAASRLKSQFLANVSHEIRTPMNGILGMTSLALETPLDAEQQEYLSGVQSSARRLLRVIDDILDISKIEAAKLVLEEIPFSPAAEIGEAVHALAPLASEKGLELRFEPAHDLPRLVRGDPARVRQVVTNLLDNAIKFTATGEVALRLEPDPAGLRITARDTGPGIPEEHRERIFHAFAQGDGSITRRFGGIGLGLTISLDLVRRMGGRIELDSEVGRGSTFRVTLALPVEAGPIALPTTGAGPDARVDSGAGAGSVVAAGCATGVGSGQGAGCGSSASRTREATATSPPAAGHPLRVLLVEDDRVNTRVATRMLERLGHRVAHAENGAVALEMLAGEAYDVVLMDMQMPVMDGIEATHRLRERENGGPRLPVIALTANAMEEHREACLASGMDAYLTKPLDRALLAETLERFAPRGVACAAA